MTKMSFSTATSLFVLLLAFGAFTFFLGQSSTDATTMMIFTRLLLGLCVAGAVTLALYMANNFASHFLDPAERLKRKLAGDSSNLVDGVLVTVTNIKDDLRYTPHLFLLPCDREAKSDAKYNVHWLDVLHPTLAKMLLSDETSFSESGVTYARVNGKERVGSGLYIKIEVPAEHAVLFDIAPQPLSMGEAIEKRVRKEYGPAVEGIFCVAKGSFRRMLYTPSIFLFPSVKPTSRDLDPGDDYLLLTAVSRGIEKVFFEKITLPGVDVKGVIRYADHEVLAVEVSQDVAYMFDVNGVPVPFGLLVPTHLHVAHPSVQGVIVRATGTPDDQVFEPAVFVFDPDDHDCLDGMSSELGDLLSGDVTDRAVNMSQVIQQDGKDFLLVEIPYPLCEDYGITGEELEPLEVIANKMHQDHGADVKAIWIELTDVPKDQEFDPIVVPLDADTAQIFAKSSAEYDLRDIDDGDTNLAYLLKGEANTEMVTFLGISDLEGVKVVHYQMTAANAEDYFDASSYTLDAEDVIEREIKAKFGEGIHGMLLTILSKSYRRKYLKYALLFEDVSDEPLWNIEDVETMDITVLDDDLATALMELDTTQLTFGETQEFVPGLNLVYITISEDTADDFDIAYEDLSAGEGLIYFLRDTLNDNKVSGVLVEVLPEEPLEWGEPAPDPSKKSRQYAPQTLYIADEEDESGVLRVGSTYIYCVSELEPDLAECIIEHDPEHPVEPPTLLETFIKLAVIKVRQVDAGYFSLPGLPE